jgi:hypothetical protein
LTDTNYAVTPYSVTLDITPGTSANPLDFIIGQRVLATLNINGSQVNPFPSASNDSYSWSIDGDSAFDGYNPVE